MYIRTAFKCFPKKKRHSSRSCKRSQARPSWKELFFFSPKRVERNLIVKWPPILHQSLSLKPGYSLRRLLLRGLCGQFEFFFFLARPINVTQAKDLPLRAHAMTHNFFGICMHSAYYLEFWTMRVVFVARSEDRANLSELNLYHW
jgi:hypothetical protein